MLGSILKPKKRPEAMTDPELAAFALTGSEDAFRELVRRFERPIYSLIVRMVQDPSLAEDLAQEVFVKAYRGLGKFLTTAIVARDYTSMQGVFLVIAISVVVANMLADVLYGALDPRVRMGKER